MLKVKHLALLALLILTACGSGSKGGGSSGGGDAPVNPASVSACNNGGLNGNFHTTTPGTTSFLSIQSCNFTLIYGNGCSIDGTIANESNSGGSLYATITNQTGTCGNISSGTCNFSRATSGMILNCDSLYIPSVYFEVQ